MDGFLTTRIRGVETTTYNYSTRGELLAVGMANGSTIEYVHDPMGRRIAKKVDGVIIEKYLWSGLTQLLAVYDGADTLLMRFEYADARMPVAMTSGGATYYLAYDQVGSLRVVADSAGAVVKEVEYDSFGNVSIDTNPAFAMPFGFAGGLHDRDTGLVRFGYRDYDPDIGRWTAKDPILFEGGDTDLFGYVQNDPVNWIDPWGLRTLSFGQNAFVAGASSVTAMTASFFGTPVAGAVAGATVGVFLTAAMGGDSDDMWNNGISGALGGLAGGMLGNLGKAAAGVRPGVGQAMGFLAGEGVDTSLLGADPLVGDDCD